MLSVPGEGRGQARPKPYTAKGAVTAPLATTAQAGLPCAPPSPSQTPVSNPLVPHRLLMGRAGDATRERQSHNALPPAHGGPHSLGCSPAQDTAGLVCWA